jgi:hypothetical protein
MKVLRFIDTDTGGASEAGVNEHTFPADRLTAITKDNDQEFDLWFSNSDGGTTDHKIHITTTLANQGPTLQEYFAMLVAHPDTGGLKDRVYTFTGGDEFQYGGVVISNIDYTAGS